MIIDFQIIYQLNFQPRDKTHDDIGYLLTLGENIYFGIRDQKTIENSIDIDYRIDNKKSINLNFRNFWSVADYDEVLFKLKDDGYREISEYALLESILTQISIFGI